MDPKDQVKDVLSIVDVVSTYIRLEKSGAQYKARCPFHNEKTPSFYVSPERRSFHCFGCQTHGDIFTFVEKIENIPFFEALKILADRAGVTLTNSEKQKVDSRLVALLGSATLWYEKNLSQSGEAKSYLLERGLTEETVKTFHIGYAKNEWRDLFIHLASLGYTPEEMEEAGVSIKTEKGYYDRFRGRIMFPIRNISGVTVGYSGRILPQFVDPTAPQGKYVNTPETPLYHKSKILFGYDTGKRVMMEKKEVVVVEGQMDLCMSYQAGVHNTIAVSGTAFTDEHIKSIKRFCDKVVLSFDSDSAGQSALKKSAFMCLLSDLDVYVVSSLETKDPADLIKDDPQAWIQAIEGKEHIVTTMTKKIISSVHDDREANKQIVKEVLPFVRVIASPVDRGYFLRQVSEMTKISEDILREEMMRIQGVVGEQGIEHEEKVSLHPLERITKELIAFTKLFSKEDLVKDIALDMKAFPDEIIEEEMFRIEKQVHADKEVYAQDLLSSYKRELHKDKKQKLQKKFKEEGADHEAIMKELQEVSKEEI